MSARSKRSSRLRRGAAMVEITLTFMLLMGILFSIFDFGYVLFMHQSLLHAAQSAVRYGVVRPYDAAAIRSMVLHGTPAGSGTGLFGLTDANVEVSREAGTAADPNRDRIVVRIKDYTYPALTWFIAGRHKGKPIVASLTVEEH